MRPPFEPLEPVKPAPPLSQTIKGQHPPKLEGRDWVYGTLPPEQPLREEARQRRRMDSRGGLKTNVKLSISPACHPERSRENFVIRGQGLTLSPHVPRTSPLPSSVFPAACTLSAPTGHLPRKGNAIKLSGRTFLAPHRGSCPKGLCKRTGFLGVKRLENPVRRHFERSEMRGLRSGIA